MYPYLSVVYYQVVSWILKLNNICIESYSECLKFYSDKDNKAKYTKLELVMARISIIKTSLITSIIRYRWYKSNDLVNSKIFKLIIKSYHIYLLTINFFCFHLIQSF